MGHNHDYWEGWRGWLIPKLGAVAQLIEDVTGGHYYVRGETHNNQFVGRIPMSEEEFEKELHDLGFHRNPLSAWKTLNSTGETEEASFRKIGFEDSPKYQLHVVLYDGSNIQNAETDHTYVYAHWEYRWDIHPIKHYRGENKSGSKGVQKMKNMLDAEGIVYELIRP